LNRREIELAAEPGIGKQGFDDILIVSKSPDRHRICIRCVGPLSICRRCTCEMRSYGLEDKNVDRPTGSRQAYIAGGSGVPDVAPRSSCTATTLQQPRRTSCPDELQRKILEGERPGPETIKYHSASSICPRSHRRVAESINCWLLQSGASSSF